MLNITGTCVQVLVGFLKTWTEKKLLFDKKRKFSVESIKETNRA